MPATMGATDYLGSTASCLSTMAISLQLLERRRCWLQSGCISLARLNHYIPTTWTPYLDVPSHPVRHHQVLMTSVARDATAVAIYSLVHRTCCTHGWRNATLTHKNTRSLLCCQALRFETPRHERGSTDARPMFCVFPLVRSMIGSSATLAASFNDDLIYEEDVCNDVCNENMKT